MKSCTILIVLISACISPLQTVYAQSIEQAHIDSLLIELGKAKDDTNKVRIYAELLWQHVYYKGDKGLDYAAPAIELAKKLRWQQGVFIVSYNIGRIYWKLGKFNEALKWHAEALSIAQSSGNQDQLIRALTAIGQDHADNANYNEALKYFNQSRDVADKIGNKMALQFLYGLLSFVYRQQGNYPESTKNNLTSLRMAEQAGDIYGAAITMTNLGEDYRELDNDSLALHYLNSSIVLQQRMGNDMNNLGLSYLCIGSIHLKHKNYTEASKYFEIGLQTGKDIDDKRLMSDAYSDFAAISIENGNDSSALKYLLLAVEALNGQDVYQQIALLYVDIGACYTRLRAYALAKKYFDTAWSLAKKIESEEVQNQYYGSLELLDSALGNWKGAYLNYKTHIRIGQKIYNDANTKKQLQTSMQYEFDKKEASARAEQEKKDTQQRTIRNSIAAVLVGSLIFLVVVVRQRNKISKARKRSDELLLNILPSEVAEELKAKGSADAKQYDDVTVMFTDFKDFTQISEKLSPAELVSEIDSCFKAFDNIITKHNIEKIKTIGDSYMCAGGLPVANITHASDVVNAALEIRDFMASRRTDTQNPQFEIRIGVHTGPVVAGIVGVKKFAYDIWGDTVNIASRMEGSGEAGRINISGGTYELVKDIFACTYRGKIQAKNKGEIDMYFVEDVL